MNQSEARRLIEFYFSRVCDSGITVRERRQFEMAIRELLILYPIGEFLHQWINYRSLKGHLISMGREF